MLFKPNTIIVIIDDTHVTWIIYGIVINGDVVIAIVVRVVDVVVDCGGCG